MKKIIITLLFIAGTFGFLNASAQQTPVKKTSTVKMKDSTTVTKTGTKTGMKKDGTPDMRYKQNKITTKKTVTSGPMKKNGTPDMRYKANKDSVK